VRQKRTTIPVEILAFVWLALKTASALHRPESAN
jgi:hypothetical protein